MREPLIVIGTGRCGSTALHQVLGRHPRLGWLTETCVRWPGRPGLNALAMRLLDLPPLTRALSRRLDPKEAYELWARIWPGFVEPIRDPVEADATPDVVARAHRVLSRTLGGRRDRLLLKITGWPRVGFLRAVFPDARFVHVYRDGRAVAASLLRQDWWSGWRGPDSWRWGPLSTGQRERWERSDRSFLVLAGLEWELLMEAFDEARRSVPGDGFLDVRYEDLCATPEPVLREILEFGGLEWTKPFERAVRAFPLRSANDRWSRDLTGAQQDALEEAIAPTLARYGYL